MRYTREEVKERLQKELDLSLEEIKGNGLNSIYDPEQLISSARITIEIDADCIATVRYEKTTFPHR